MNKECEQTGLCYA